MWLRLWAIAIALSGRKLRCLWETVLSIVPRWKGLLYLGIVLSRVACAGIACLYGCADKTLLRISGWIALVNGAGGNGRYGLGCVLIETICMIGRLLLVHIRRCDIASVGSRSIDMSGIVGIGWRQHA